MSVNLFYTRENIDGNDSDLSWLHLARGPNKKRRRRKRSGVLVIPSPKVLVLCECHLVLHKKNIECQTDDNDSELFWPHLARAPNSGGERGGGGRGAGVGP